MRRMKRFRSKLVLVTVLTIGILAFQMAVDTVSSQAGLYSEDDSASPTEPTSEPTHIPGATYTPEPTPGATYTPEPTQTPSGTPGATHTPKPTRTPGATHTPKPTRTPGVTRTPKPSGTPGAAHTPEPTATPRPKALQEVQGVKLQRYATNAIKVTWKKNKKAKYYRVYYSQKKSGSYRCAGVTKKTWYLVKKLKNKTTYYFYVQACRAKKRSDVDSAPSARAHMKTKTYSRKIVFAGDSICQGIGYPGWAYPYMHISGKKKVVAYRGLNTVTFHTKRVFHGRTGLQKLIAEKPYRAYMMLGVNEIHFRNPGEMIAEYKGMVQAIQQASPNTDIVLCAISPVTRTERARHSGFRQIPIFNKKLKKLAEDVGVRYFDYTAFLKDAGGYLKAGYAERDGYHWKMPVYAEFAKRVAAYDKSLDS